MKQEVQEEVLLCAKWEIKPKIHKQLTKRWGHTSVLIKNKLYIYGGKTGKTKEPLFQIDCDTFENKVLQTIGMVDSRQSHSCNQVKGKLYIWGGCQQQKALNDCFSLSIKEKECICTNVKQSFLIKQRESHATTVLEDKYILLYGGCDDQLIYDDFWILNTQLGSWSQIRNIYSKMTKRLSCTLSTINSHVYMFGGQQQDDNYLNQLYKLSISPYFFDQPDKSPQMKCQLINPRGKAPSPRSSHATTTLRNQYLLIIGGQGYGLPNNRYNNNISMLLNDVWAFNTLTIEWLLIQTGNSQIFKPRSCFTANSYNDKVIIFGGLISTQNFSSTDQLLVLSFSNSKKNRIQVCNICKLHFSPMIRQQNLKNALKVPLEDNFRIGIKNIQKLAKFIKNPLDAFKLLLEGFYLMDYKKLIINNYDTQIKVFGQGHYLTQNDFEYILQKYDFAQDIYFQSNQIQSTLEQRVMDNKIRIFNSNIKNACFRLGNSFLFLNRRSSLIDMLLIDMNNVIYCEKSIEEQFVSTNQKKSYQIIIKYIEKYNINVSNLKNQSFWLIIGDIDNQNTQLNEYTESETTSYFSQLFLDNPLQIIYNQNQVHFEQIYKKYLGIPDFQVLNDSGIRVFQNFQIKLKNLKEKQPQKIQIYRNSIRIWTYQFAQEPSIAGYITIPSQFFQLNLMRTKLEPQSQKNLEKVIRIICKNFYNQSEKRKRTPQQYNLSIQQ